MGEGRIKNSNWIVSPTTKLAGADDTGADKLRLLG